MDEVERLVSEIYARSLPRLCAYGFALTGSHAEAEELVQAAIVKTFVGRARRFPNAAAAEAYVRTAMRTLRIDAVRRDERWRRIRPALVDRGGGDDAAALVVGMDDVGAALAGLPPKVRLAAALRFYDELSVDEVAAAMAIPVGTAKTLLHRARQVLAPWLAEERGGDEAARVAAPVRGRAESRVRRQGRRARP